MTNSIILDKSQIKFYPNNFSAVANIGMVNGNQEIIRKAEKFDLNKKNEYHITIIWTRTWEKIQEILNSLSEIERKSRISELKILIDSFESNIELLDEFYYIEKHYEDKNPLETRKSIIQMIDIENIGEFYDKLSQLFEHKFLVPLWHITLYTTSDNPENTLRWIWIYSQTQFQQLNPVRL